MNTTRTTCPYCGVGCGVRVHRDVDTERAADVIRIQGDDEHPANFGRLCAKGAALADTVGMNNRLLAPHIHGRAATWERALDLVSQTFIHTIAQHGPDSVAFYLSGQILTEDYYVANKLMKGYIGSANVDTNSRLCMASSVAGHKRAFGADTVPGQYEDIELADLVVLVGSNLAWCHPVLYQRLVAAKSQRPSMRIVVIDPRRTMTADTADLHLAIEPDGDAALFNGLLAWLSCHGLINTDYVDRHTNGFDQALQAAQSMRSVESLAATGLPGEQLRQFYDWFARTNKVVTIYSQGVNQSSCGSDKVNAILNCHLATGRIGQPGMGPFSVTGQPNAMGGREVGGLANMLAAHTDLDNPAHRSLVQRFWGSPRMADRAGLKAVDLFDAVANGQIKALWIMATNPVDSMPDAAAVSAALTQCPFVVVSDVQVNTDTVACATVQLPSAAWGEKDGTVTNSERRISRQRAFLPMPTQVRSDWWQICEVAARMGYRDAFDFDGPAAIFREHAALSSFENDGSRDFDIGWAANLADQDYQSMAPFCWPRPVGAASDVTRFFANGGFFTPDRRGRFHPVQSATPINQPSIDGVRSGLVLNTGRIRDQWHTMTRTGVSATLSAHLAEPFAEIHPLDAAMRAIEKADLVRVSAVVNGVHRDILVRALITERQRPGSIFVPMHFTDQVTANARVDKLITARCDPTSGQPALKSMAVQVTKYPATMFGFLISRVKPELAPCDYWAFAPCQYGWRAELGLRDAPVDLAAFARSLTLIDQRLEPLVQIDCVDLSRRLFRYAWLAPDRTVHAVAYFGPEPVNVSRAWVVSRLGQPLDAADAGALLAGRQANGVADPGALVCACMNVGRFDIARAVAEGCDDLESIGDACRAGTNCGSCRAEIQEILKENQAEGVVHDVTYE